MIRVQKRSPDLFRRRVEDFTTRARSIHERALLILSAHDARLALRKTRAAPAPKTAELGGAARDGHSRESALLRDTLNELRTQHEALLVAEEELRVQLDELRRVQTAIDVERFRYRSLFDAAPDPYLVTDRVAVIRDANVAALKLLEIEGRFIRGKPLSVFVEPGDIRAMSATLDRLDRGSAQLVELRLRPRRSSSSKSPHRFAVVAHVSLSTNGTSLLWVMRLVAADDDGDGAVLQPMPNSGLQQEPERLQRMLRDKEELVERARKARQELERTNEAKDRFIAVLSHDLRAPLNAILGWTQLLRREVLDQHARKRAVETIERNARAQAKLIDELLDISRMASERVQLALAPIDLGSIVERVVEGALPRAAELSIALTVKAEPELTVLADRQRIEQILTNLVTNALKFTPAGGAVTVEATKVAADAEDDGRERVVITVRDTGIGIEDEALPRIFDRYVQDRNSSTQQQRAGLGLGLFIVKQLTELQSGRVAAASEGKGKGSVFTISFPLRHATPIDLPSAPSSEMSVVPDLETTPLHDLRVLVVDDEDDSRELMTMILRRAGADVGSASGLKTAVDIFSVWSPDVVVSDLAMPGGDGRELVTLLRERVPSIAAVVVSGFTAEKDTSAALAAGFDVHVGKPVDSQELIDAILEASRLRALSR